MPRKAAKKAASNRAPGRPFTKGDPRINRTKPGPGAPPSELRAQLRGSFAERIATLEQFADGAMPLKERCPACGFEQASTLATALPVDASDRLRALDMLAKYGLGTVKEVTVENVRERVMATLAVIRQRCSEEQAAAIVAELRPIWA